MRHLFAVVLCLTQLTFADAPATQPAGDVPKAERFPYTIKHETRTDPPMRLWSIQVDLTDPRTQVKVIPGGADPDGPGPWQTTLAPVTGIAEREKLDLAVNASFFAVDKTGEWAGKGYTADQPAKAIGWTMTDRNRWSADSPAWPVLWIDRAGRGHVSETAAAADAQQMVAGNAWLLRDGQDAVPTEGVMTKRHPRTAVGVNREGTTLTILVVDGRQPGVSIGMTGAELRDELLKLGVDDAINLDGGGSTTLVERDKTSGNLQIVNKPSDPKPRPVANVVGVTVTKP